MPKYHETRTMPYWREEIFDLVADIAKYPEFLPWCNAARIVSRQAIVTDKDTDQTVSSVSAIIDSSKSQQSASELVADLVIGYGPLRDTYRSLVQLKPYGEITVTYLSGPLKSMRTFWQFAAPLPNAPFPNAPLPNATGPSCTIEFFVELEFKNRILQVLIERFFTEAVERMVSAFEQRAAKLYRQ